MHKIAKLYRDKRGATAIEYGLIAALIAVAAISAMTTVGTRMRGNFNNIGNKLQNVSTL